LFGRLGDALEAEEGGLSVDGVLGLDGLIGGGGGGGGGGVVTVLLSLFVFGEDSFDTFVLLLLLGVIAVGLLSF
jgi:hypothetical protein